MKKYENSEEQFLGLTRSECWWGELKAAIKSPLNQEPFPFHDYELLMYATKQKSTQHVQPFMATGNFKNVLHQCDAQQRLANNYSIIVLMNIFEELQPIIFEY